MLLFKNWFDQLLIETKKTQRLNIVSPFVKESVIRTLADKIEFKNLQLITRFNLSDFASGVSSLSALRVAIENGAKVYGVKDLHSKMYIFDSRLSIISSANLTMGGLVNNHECGVRLEDAKLVQQTLEHFNYLKQIAKHPLTIEQCEAWQKILDSVVIPSSDASKLPDYGGGIKVANLEKNYYVKFFGTNTNRVELNFSVRQEVERALCHYACGFSENKPPIQINEGDTIYLARMITNPRDYSIFGKAIAVKFDPTRDRFTEQEIQSRSWKRDWPIYLRIDSPVFIDGTMADCPFLFDLIGALDYASFPTTLQKYEDGIRGINPKLSLARQPYVRLTAKAVEWLEPKFQDALTRCGSIPESFVSLLPQAPVEINL